MILQNFGSVSGCFFLSRNAIPPSPEAYGSTPMIIPSSPTHDVDETAVRDEDESVNPEPVELAVFEHPVGSNKSVVSEQLVNLEQLKGSQKMEGSEQPVRSESVGSVKQKGSEQPLRSEMPVGAVKQMGSEQPVRSEMPVGSVKQMGSEQLVISELSVGTIEQMESQILIGSEQPGGSEQPMESEEPVTSEQVFRSEQHAVSDKQSGDSSSSGGTILDIIVDNTMATDTQLIERNRKHVKQRREEEELEKVIEETENDVDNDDKLQESSSQVISCVYDSFDLVGSLKAIVLIAACSFNNMYIYSPHSSKHSTSLKRFSLKFNILGSI